MVENIINDARKIKEIEWVYFEGGEPFLYYPIMICGVKIAKDYGFNVGIVTNGYWAVTVDDAVNILEPLSKLEISELSLSSDKYHGLGVEADRVKNGMIAARRLRIKSTVLSVDECPLKLINLPHYVTKLMYRGRAAVKLTSKAHKKAWYEYVECPYEDLENPERVHVDPYGYVHVCQGITIGNIFTKPIHEIIKNYNPRRHPIVAPLIKGGPVELARKYNVKCEGYYADACHLCYNIRCNIRKKYPKILAPNIVYGEHV